MNLISHLTNYNNKIPKNQHGISQIKNLLTLLYHNQH